MEEFSFHSIQIAPKMMDFLKNCFQGGMFPDFLELGRFKSLVLASYAPLQKTRSVSENSIL